MRRDKFLGIFSSPSTELEFLEGIYKRLGWALFWLFLIFVAVSGSNYI